jgi:hypothetical protein
MPPLGSDFDLTIDTINTSQCHEPTPYHITGMCRHKGAKNQDKVEGIWDSCHCHKTSKTQQAQFLTDTPPQGVRSHMRLVLMLI